MGVVDVIWHGLRDALLMAYEVWWALAFGFVVSGIVQAWVPRARIEGALSGSGARPVALATGLGAASSSCSYAAIAIAKSLFEKGASAASALAFQFASTNLVWELGLVLWVLIGWPFTLGEYLGGILMIALMTLGLRVFVSRRDEDKAREHTRDAEAGHEHHAAGESMPWRTRLTSVAAWSDVAHNVRGDWQMLYREIGIGFLLAGFAAQVSDGVLRHVFLTSAPPFVQAVWGALVGPLIAVASFVCSVGNVPLAAVLWSGGISFAGVMAFLFADLIILPILAIYRKYYGARYAIRIAALMFTTMVIAGLGIDGIFSAAGIVPSGRRPTRHDIFGSVTVGHTLVLDLVGLVLFAALFVLTLRRGAQDPVCGMTVDRAKALRSDAFGRTTFFCSEGCRAAFEAEPGRYRKPPDGPSGTAT